ncbi:MAG: UDP-N-acetylmuramoyl-L-alanyl-D-glutamate--2,6-diaminopimelate ligase [Oscillospiraceae bacterium]|nr:UDP-N-acetylmuramoyl-L-alanyl-D-glutamate--2,6-diaminopimelate ligase [Oscillospiraceae bacterium]
MITLKQLLSLADIGYTGADAQVNSVTDDTHDVSEGDVFVCIKGTRFDGHDAAADMLRRGAVCVIADHDLGLDRQVIVPDTWLAYGRLVAELSGRPDRKLTLIGITGTNGKTTTATLIHHILMSSGIRCGFIGTTQVLSGDVPVPRDESTPTTPKARELFELFSRMAEDGCTHCVMEVSSFALAQDRIGPAVYDVSVFTNLTQDHLDYHGDMENYFRAKELLFTRHSKFSLINEDDGYGVRLLSELDRDRAKTYGRQGEYSYVSHGFADGVTRFDYCGGENCSFALPMIGEYNVSNCTAAVAVCESLGIPMEKIRAAVDNFDGVRGRCEIIPTHRDYTVMCDYAHSPDALENVLSCVRDNTDKRVICLFGCGGDRDKTKRPLMAAAAAKFSDLLIVTSDNPRTEVPDAIIDDIIPGIPEGINYIRITDRRQAIAYALATAKKGDIVVLAGKGHEDYQIIGTTHHHFDEREVVSEALEDIGQKLTGEDIARYTGGEDRTKGFIIDAENISSDTRTITGDSIFIGLKGENFDGSDFIGKAVELGAKAVITDRDTDLPSVRVVNTRRALLDIARGYRKRFDIPLVGLTGSVGKTTTKEMTARVLSSCYETLWTQGNRNNEIGMPFTLLRLKAEHRAAVIEMGMSHFGEISRMTRTCLPTVCVITNIGWSHAENLGDRDGILKAKLEILEGASDDAPLVVCGDDDKLAPLKGKLRRRVVTCGLSDGNDYTARDITDTDEGTAFTVVYGDERGKVTLGCKGTHHVTDALLDIAAGREAGVPLDRACMSLDGYAPGGLRQHIEERNGIRCVIDCYNAAPASMRAALDVLSKVEGERHIAVLADMLELGGTTERLHYEVGEYAASLGVEVICYGGLSENTANGAVHAGGKGTHFKDKSALISHLKKYLRSGDAVLFKASRGMKMEEVLDAVTCGE